VDPTARTTLGRSGVRVTRLGLGMAALGDAGRTSDDVAAAVLARTASLGLGYVDTAAEYGLGLAERRLGSALAELPAGTLTFSTKLGRLVRAADRGYRVRHTLRETFSSRTGARIFARKVARTARRGLPTRSPAALPDHAAAVAAQAATASRDLARQPAAVCAFSYDGMMRSFEESLARLGTDRIDLVYTHEPDLHVDQASRDGYRALERLRASGAVGAIGVAINDPDALLTFADRGDYDCFLVGGRYTLLEQPALDRLLPTALARGISIVLGGPFNSGILADPRTGALFDYVPADARLLERARRLDQVCRRHGVPLKAAALQFPLGHPAVVSVVVGAATVAELEEDAALMGLEIPPALWDELRHEGLIHPDAPAPATGPNDDATGGTIGLATAGTATS
jgi:D-threo-aldose 1-dehydrogenase